MENEQKAIARELIDKVHTILGDLPDPNVRSYRFNTQGSLKSESLTIDLNGKKPGQSYSIELSLYSKTEETAAL